MSSRQLLTPPLMRVLVTAAAACAALMVGTLLVRDPKLGIAFVGALVFVPVAFITPPLALAGWLVSAFLTELPGFGGQSNRALMVVFVVWVGSLIATRTGPNAIRERVPQFGLVLLFVFWVLLTLTWAPRPDVIGDLWLRLAMTAIVYLMVVTLVTQAKYARWLAAAFVVGCVLSILAGIAIGGIEPATTDSATSQSGRFQGGTGDPNYLAAAIVPAVVLAGALAARRGRPFVRLGLMVGIGILAIGLAATESRGGFIAIAIVSIGALILWKGKRLMVASMIVALVAAGAVWFTMYPAGMERLTSNKDGGSGRTDIWTVAWRVGEANPVFGVGVDQFRIVSQDYIRQPGSLRRADLIVGGYVVHNVYLQLWAETGLVGLLLFLAIAFRSIMAAYQAAGRFDARGDPEMAMLARAAMLAVIGALAASFFLSNVLDQRLWALMGLCPALLVIARREAAADAESAASRQEIAR